MHFTILLQIQNENNFLPTSEHELAKVRRFLGICLHNCFISSSENVSKRDAILASVAKQLTAKLRQPIKTRENCYLLIW